MRALLALLLAALALAPLASADGDPASDWLVQQNVFLPTPPPSASAAATLDAEVSSVASAGDRIKVAVIATPQDLGSVSSLFGQPAAYAKFLGLELAFVYKGPLLVAMPAGLGFAVDGAAAPAAAPVLAAQQVTGPDPSSLATSAAAAVAALEQAGALRVKDTTKPQVWVPSQTAAAGKRASLRYEAWDDSGTARVDVQVDKGSKTVASFRVPFRSVEQSAVYRVTWKRVPPRFAHTALALCVRATDRAGNRSALTCAKLTVSRS